MKGILFSSILITTLFISCIAYAGQSITIYNHTFGIITVDETQISDEKIDDECIKKYKRVTAFIQNENCVAAYKIAVGETIIGEGTLDFRNFRSKSIQLGQTKFGVGCKISGTLIFTEK